MKILEVFLVLTILISSVSVEAKTKTLFNGKNLKGWTIKKNPKDDQHSYFYVENGAIVANSLESNGHDYVWLQSNKEYDDFELELQFAFDEETKGNSGVQIRSRYQDSILWLDGPQVDINPNGTWRSGFVWDETKENQRWIYPNIEKKGAKWAKREMREEEAPFYISKPSKKLKWNKMKIVAKGVDVQAYLNGVQITDLKGEGILNDAIHAKRKVGMDGHVALQIHKKAKLKIHFKDIKIKQL